MPALRQVGYNRFRKAPGVLASLRIAHTPTTSKERFVKTLSFAFLAFATSLLVSADLQSATSAPDLSGRWEVTTSYPGGSFVAGLDLAVEAGKYSGKSGYLVPDSYWYKYSGALQDDGLHLQILGPDGKT
jgi:hypothetical protein